MAGCRSPQPNPEAPGGLGHVRRAGFGDDLVAGPGREWARGASLAGAEECSEGSQVDITGLHIGCSAADGPAPPVAFSIGRQPFHSVSMMEAARPRQPRSTLPTDFRSMARPARSVLAQPIVGAVRVEGRPRTRGPSAGRALRRARSRDRKHSRRARCPPSLRQTPFCHGLAHRVVRTGFMPDASRKSSTSG